jgi:ferredoxin-NADP reductase
MMEEHIVKIISVINVTHDVKCIQVEKPKGYTFFPGQATDISINTPELRNENRAFTFTCLNSDPYLEFTIKHYPNRQSITNLIHQLKENDEIIIHEVFGEISYKGEGTFIAGGAGITPFISIFRDLQAKHSLGNNILVYANKTRADIILENEFRDILGNKFINILSEEKIVNCYHGYITEEFLRSVVKDLSTMFYVCGPPPMMNSVVPILRILGVTEKSLILEPM